MPILDDREMRRIVECRVLEDSKDQNIFKGCKMIRRTLQLEQVVPEYNVFGNLTGIYEINGYVRVDIHSDETHPFYVHPKRGRKGFSGKLSSDGELLLNWQRCERV